MVSFKPRLLYPRGKSSRYPLNRKLDGEDLFLRLVEYFLLRKAFKIKFTTSFAVCILMHLDYTKLLHDNAFICLD
jgi:hypothetical protein